jgi:hypothetical protein
MAVQITFLISLAFMNKTGPARVGLSVSCSKIYIKSDQAATENDLRAAPSTLAADVVSNARSDDDFSPCNPRHPRLNFRYELC